MNLEQLRQAFWYAYDNPQSGFYKEFYRARGLAPSQGFPQTVQEWETIPLLTKEDIAAVPLERRLFVPRDNVPSYRVSSGTSNRGIVLIPRTYVRDFAYWRRFISRGMLFHKSPHLQRTAAQRAGLVTIDADPGDLRTTAQLVALAEVDGFLGISPSVLTALIPHLEELFDLSRIRCIELSGERVSAAKHELFRKKFPNSLLHVDYASSESASLGGEPCEELLRAHSMLVHPSEDLAHIELLDPTGKPVRTGEEGEVVLTLGVGNNAFPLLRYRTEDVARQVPNACSCARDTYEMLGRASYDRAYVPGGLITSAELERVLALYRENIEDDFQLHVYQDEQPPRLELLIRAREGARIDIEELATGVAKSLHIAPNRVLADSMTAGLCAPLRCVLLREGVIQKGKELRIIVH